MIYVWGWRLRRRKRIGARRGCQRGNTGERRVAVSFVTNTRKCNAADASND